MVQLSPGAEELLAFLKAHDIKTLLVSGGFTFFTERLQSQLGLTHTGANILDVCDGKLTGELVGPIVDAQGKLDVMRRVCAQHGFHEGEVLGMGDGANDLRFLAECAVSVAHHAKPVVQARTTYALNYTGLDNVRYLLGHRGE